MTNQSQSEGAFSHERSMQYFFAGFGSFFAGRVRASGLPAWSGATRSGIQQLEPDGGDVVLSFGQSAVVARDLRRAGGLRRQVEASGGGQGPDSFDVGLRE